MRESVRFQSLVWTLLCLNLFISFIQSYPSLILDQQYDWDEENERVQFKGRLKRSPQFGDEGGGPPPDADPFIPILEKLAEALNLKGFTESHERSLYQKLNRINDISKYLDPKTEAVIFERSQLDLKKDAVVLTNLEDHRTQNASLRKRTYTVLKNHPSKDPKKPMYFLLFAYIRDGKSTDISKDLVEVEGNKVTVEWDVWEDRAVAPTFPLGWKTCAYSLLFACTFNATAVEMAIDPKIIEEISASMTTKNPAAATTTTTASSVSSTASPPRLELVAKEGSNPQEYYDLYSDFDMAEHKQAGRTFDGIAPVGNSTKKTKPKKKKKIIKIVKAQTGNISPQTAAASAQYSQYYSPTGGGGITISNAEATLGKVYKGFKGTPQIFIQDQARIGGIFVPESPSSSTNGVHGLFIPGSLGFPDSFLLDEVQESPYENVVGTFIPDLMTASSVTGGIKGKLSGETFYPDSMGSTLWYSPDFPEVKKIFSLLPKPDPSLPKRPKMSPDGKAIVYGTSFPGVSGSPDIFIPEGIPISGYFVANDPKQPNFVGIPHGQFIATKPSGHGVFFPSNAGELEKIELIRGAFMPDGMNLTGAIGGLLSKDVANSFNFVVDVPGHDFDYYKGRNDTEIMWTPFLAPGEFKYKPPAKPTSPTLEITTPRPGAPAKIRPKNLAFMYGGKFPGMGTLDVFIPDGYPVDGVMNPQDSAFPHIPGYLMANGKNTNQKIEFKPANMEDLKGLPPSLSAFFEPEGILAGNGVIGELICDVYASTCKFESDPPAKGYWYVKGKPENEAIWTPFLPPPAPATSILDKTQKFFSGYYYPGSTMEEDVFIPDDGAEGCILPDDTSLPKICGQFLPEIKGSPSQFILKDPTNPLVEGMKGYFVPEMTSGAESMFKLHGTCTQTTFVPDDPPAAGFSHSDIKTVRNSSALLTLAAVEAANSTDSPKDNSTDRPTDVAIGVGGGFSGYPTNGKGVEALINPNHPIFKEFLHFKSRQDKSIVSNSKIVILPTVNGTQVRQLNGTSYVGLDEYRQYVDDMFNIKSTKIEGELLEIAVPKAADKYLKKKKKKKPLSINVNLNSNAQAGAGAGGTTGGVPGPGGGSAGGSASGGVTGTGPGGKKCGGKFSSSASASAIAENGGTANSEASAINGGDAKAVSNAKDGATAGALANVEDGGKANALSLAKNGANGTAEANALNGATANAASILKKENGTGAAVSNAKKLDDGKANEGCEGGGLPEEIEVDSHASATAVSGGGNGTGGGGNVVNSYANTNVKIDMGSLFAKIQEMQKLRAESDDDDDDDEVISINVNTASQAGAGAAGRSVNGEEEEEPKPSNTMLKNGAKLRAGWKTEYKIVTPNCTLDYEKDVFYGLGHCPYGAPNTDAILKSNDPEQVIDFYVKVLRMDCTNNAKNRITKLLNQGWIDYSSDFDYFIFNDKNPSVAQAKVSDSDIRKLSTAFELFVFTKTYVDHLKAKDSTAIAPYLSSVDGKPSELSRSIRFFTEFSLNYIETSRKIVPHHYIRLTRNILNSLRSLMTRLYQDRLLIDQCTGCVLDQELNQNDQLHIQGILQLFIHGLAPYEKGEVTDLRQLFKDFIKSNLAYLEDKVKDYKINFPSK